MSVFFSDFAHRQGSFAAAEVDRGYGYSAATQVIHCFHCVSQTDRRALWDLACDLHGPSTKDK
jgi:hypothetical protein